MVNSVVYISYPSWSVYGNQASAFDMDAVNEVFGMGPCAQGIVIVEMWYLHKQAMGLPVWTWAVPDPIELYAFSIMPNATATSDANEICIREQLE